MEKKTAKRKWLPELILLVLLVLGIKYSDLLFHALGGLLRVLSPFILGGAIAFVLNIPMSGIEKLLGRLKLKEGSRRGLSILLTLCIILLLIGILLGVIVPQLFLTSSELISRIPATLDSIGESLNSFAAGDRKWLGFVDAAAILQIEKLLHGFLADGLNLLKETIPNFLRYSIGAAGSIASSATNFVIAVIFSFYILAGKEKLGEQCRKLIEAYLPEKGAEQVFRISALLSQNFRNFITGQCLEAVILGMMFIMAMTVCQLPYAVMTGVLISFTALLPIVGAFIGCVLGAFFILTVSPVKALWFILLFLVLQQIEGNLIYPRVVGGSVGLPAIWVLAAVSIGGSLFGIVGMLLFIPIFSTIYALLREDVSRRIHEKMAVSRAVLHKDLEERMENFG